jgi:hypothetical protein
LQRIGEGNSEAQSHGKSKGDAHRLGLESTRSNNNSTANRLTAGVTGILGSTTDGGGGSKAGREFRGGLAGWRGQVEAAGAGIARSGRAGLSSVDTSGAGRNFVAGFRNNINDNNGSIWSRAWSLGRTALGALRSSIRTSSPSKETEETGQDFIAGFANSIEKGRKETAEKASLVGRDTLDGLNKGLEDYKKSFGAIAFAIGDNKQVLKVEHEINNSSLENEITSLKSEMKGLADLFKQMIDLQQNQVVATNEQPIVLKANERELANAVRRPLNGMNARADKRKRRMPRG